MLLQKLKFRIQKFSALKKLVAINQLKLVKKSIRKNQTLKISFNNSLHEKMCLKKSVTVINSVKNMLQKLRT